MKSFLSFLLTHLNFCFPVTIVGVTEREGESVVLWRRRMQRSSECSLHGNAVGEDSSSTADRLNEGMQDVYRKIEEGSLVARKCKDSILRMKQDKSRREQDGASIHRNKTG